MGIYRISNGQIAAQVNTLGAELQSLTDMDTGREYMWNADPAYWKRTSPVLFPLVGNYKNKQTVYEGQTYAMGQHGFARDREFMLLSVSETELWLELVSDDDTRKAYPFEFRLQLGYILMGRQIKVLWRVLNPADRTMYFSIGGHPAFNCAMGDWIGLDKEGTISVHIIGSDGLASGEEKTLPLQAWRKDYGKLQITEHLFDKDALVLERDQAHCVSLMNQEGEAYVSVRFQAPLFGLWSPPGKKAPFVCVEPWYGRCDAHDFEGTLAQREWGNCLKAGETFEAAYIIEV